MRRDVPAKNLIPLTFGSREAAALWASKLEEIASQLADHEHATLAGDYKEDANGCWIWQRRCLNSGYGAISRDGHRVAHRWYYERYVGPIPEGMDLDHLCRVRTCVNPLHLEPCSRAENSRRGAKTRLTWADVDDIRTSDLSADRLAERYGVTPHHVRAVRRGVRWADRPPQAAFRLAAEDVEAAADWLAAYATEAY